GGGMNSPETFGNFVDLTNLADIILLHLFTHADHCPNQVYYAIRNRKRHAPFQLHIRDHQEIVLATHATMNPYDPITTFPAKLLAEGAGSREFKLHFGDRARKHLAQDGALSLEENRARYRQI